ncbi:hypothetical protein [Cyclobacterium salsum]|uniref:hypothetical protein n=1 Tax=Cyclobacterium salsum TaxID=2666329 RepID=UPI001391DE26|nr:hypothetical protein [Cyclobacterium salsum]
MIGRSMILLVVIFFTMIAFIKAQEQKKIEFNHKRYQTVSRTISHKDICIDFINSVHSNDFEKSKKLRPDFFLIDVSSAMIRIPGKEPFLAGLGDYLDAYSSDSYDILALSVFLREKHNVRKDLFDKMLRGSLRLDPNNVSALYLLAKFRYENDIENDAYYLVKKLYTIDKSSKEIIRLYSLFEEAYGEIEGELPSLDDFLKYDVSYYEEE